MLTVTELEAREAAITMWGAVILLGVLSICATILFLVLIHHAWEQEKNRHAEAMQRAITTQNIGQTAWHTADVSKSQTIRQQAAKIKELEEWKAHTEKRMSDLNLSEVLKHDVQV